MLAMPFKKQKDTRRNGMILDTCALIDGRIIAITKAGFVPQDLVIPQFVIAELQYLADHGDSHKRERARYGLDVIRELQDLRRASVTIAREPFSHIKEVDDKLIALAKQYSAMLYTTDYNLNKVAQIEGVTVLNVNELAHALRPHRLPGEQLELKITQVGQDKTQGVGYLEDGTMVVVEKAGSKVGQKVVVEFSRMLQTQAGKMMFAILPDKAPALQQPSRPAAEQPKVAAPPMPRPARPQPHAPPQQAKQPAPTQKMPPKIPVTQPQPAASVQVYHAYPQRPQAQSAQAGRQAAKPSQPQPPRNGQQRQHSPHRRPASAEDRLLNTLRRQQQ